MRLKVGLFLVLFYFLTVIKLHGYDRVPAPAHGEELLYSWSGINLIETGTPISWSTLDYPKENKVFEGIVGDKHNLFMPATLWKPWLDEPPLYSLLSGGAAHLFGADRTKVIPPAYSRIPSVIASLVTMALIFLVGFKFFGYWTGVLSMIFYGLSPILVLGSRLSVPENMIALGVIGSLLLAKKYLEKPNLVFPIAVGLTAAVLGLMKPTGFFLAPLTIFLTLAKKKWGHAGIILALTLVGVAAFLAYGYYYDWDLFMKIVSIQGRRFAGWTGLAYIFNSPAYDIDLLFDGWYIFGMVAAIFFALRENKSRGLKLICLFFFYWLMVAVLSGTEQDLLPWYRYPLFPLIGIFGALGLQWLYKRADFFAMVLGIGLLLTSRFYLMNAFRPTTPTIVFRLVFFAALIPSLLDYAWKVSWAKKASQIILVAFIGLGMFFNAKYLYTIFEIRCESISCPFGPSIGLSETKLPFFWRLFVPGENTDMLTTKRPWF
ncbi:MAG: glycosyltransferase family 39 protein [Microgenomates group bacterium]